MKLKKWLVLAVALMMVIGLLAGCGGGTDEPGGDGEMPALVKIGFMGPITGANAAEGSAARNAFQLVFDQANAAGTLPYEVKVVAMDDASKPEAGASAAQKLVADPEVIAISGHWNSPVAEATIPICKSAGIPLLIWGAIGTNLTNADNYPYITRICPTDVQENQPLAQKVIEELGYKNFYIISDTTSYGKSNTAAFQAELANYEGATVVGLDEVQTGTTDFRPILSKVKSAKPDAVFFGGVSLEGGLVARQMEELGMNDILLCGISGICSEDFITAAGNKAAEGTYSIKPGTDPTKTEAGQKFLADYAAAGFTEPVGAFTPYAYHAAQVILAALESIEGAPTAEKMVDAIAHVDMTGLLGHTTFDEVGQTTEPMVYSLVVQDGAWVPWEDSEYAAGTRTLPTK
jgi:branched-chain amino acid transport system substrate-binding protein